jgi:Ca2+-binding EF-hand superfamily protein
MLENKLEEAKIELSKKPDFNLFDAFKVFDTATLGWISIADMKNALGEMGIFPTYDHIELFFKRYN